MEIRLARAVLQLFQEERPARFPAFSVREWERIYYWLDNSGMALYLLDRLHTFGLANQIPDEVLWRLELSYTNNRARTREIFDEFVRINAALAELGIRYANLKGFTLHFSAVEGPTLRYQGDLDLLIPYCDAQRVGDALKQFGYIQAHGGSSVWEFKTNIGVLPAHEDMYKPIPQRAVDVHLLPAEADGGLLDRVQMQQWNGHAFPSLNEADKFIYVAQHLFRHMRSEWTRLSWVLEFRRYLDARREDAQFWRSVRSTAATSPEIVTALGAAMLMTTVIFGDCVPAGVQAWTMDRLPTPVRAWIERYGETVLLTEFPGTKLYLLLEDALVGDTPEVKTLRRRKLFPLRPAPPVAHGLPANDTLRLRVGRARLQLRYNIFRLRFHLVQGVRYWLEAQRWKRIGAVPQG